MIKMRVIADKLPYVVICDLCGPIAAFSSANSAMTWTVYEATSLHEKCISKADDGKKISIVNIKARLSEALLGRF